MRFSSEENDAAIIVSDQCDRTIMFHNKWAQSLIQIK